MLCDINHSWVLGKGLSSQVAGSMIVLPDAYRLGLNCGSALCNSVSMPVQGATLVLHPYILPAARSVYSSSQSRVLVASAIFWAVSMLSLPVLLLLSILV